MHVAAQPRKFAAAFAAWSLGESGRFILFLPVFMAAGVIAYFSWPHEPRIWPAALMAMVLGPAGLLVPRLLSSSLLAPRLSNHRLLTPRLRSSHLSARLRLAPGRLVPGGLSAYAAPVQAACLCAAFAAAGFASAGHATRSAPAWPDLPRRAAVVSGQVSAVDILPEGRRVTLAVPSLDGAPPLARSLRIRLRDTDPAIVQAGDLITVRALLRAPSPPSYPGGWDTQRDAFFSGLGGYGFALGPAARLPAATAAAGRPRWQALRATQTLRETIASRIMAALPGTRGAIAATLLTGIGSAIPLADRTAFQASGLAHLLAVAGLHIGIVMGLSYAAVRRGLAWSEHAALFWPLKRIATLSSLAAGLGYLVLTGAHVPILRSFAMACLVALAVLTGRRALSWRALGLAAIALMLAAPEQVMGVSFQMSFAAVMALIAGWESLSPRLMGLREGGLLGGGRLRALLREGVALLATSALAGTASLPVAAYHFGTAAPYYVPANVLAVPLTALWVMPWGMVALLLMPVGLHGLALAPMGWGIAGLLWIARAVAAWPASVIAVPQMPAAALLVMMAGLIWLCLWRTPWRLAGLAGLAGGLAMAVFSARPDIVVSADARLIAVRLGGRVYVSAAPGLGRFDRPTPGRVWGVVEADERPLVCRSASCRLDIGGRIAVLMMDVQSGCEGAVVAVSHLRASCVSAPIVDALTTASAGATTIQLTAAGAVLRTDAEARGDRPWVVLAAAPSVTPRLPPAETE